MSLERFEQALLRSGSGERPTRARRDAARSAMLRATGISVAAAAAAMTTTSSSAGATAAGASAAGAGASTGAGAIATLKMVGVAKLVLLAVIAAGTATAAVVATSAPREGAVVSPVAATPAAAVVTTSAPVMAPSLAVDRSTPQPPAAEMNKAPTSSAASTFATAATRAATTPADPVAVEARLLEAARTCLRGGDRACARSRLAEHEKRFARGALADEASILGIDVALADDDRDEARRLAQALLARRPNGAWSSRVEKLAHEGSAVHEENP